MGSFGRDDRLNPQHFPVIHRAESNNKDGDRLAAVFEQENRLHYFALSSNACQAKQTRPEQPSSGRHWHCSNYDTTASNMTDILIAATPDIKVTGGIVYP